MQSVLVVGTGLIGASIGLALHDERRVLLTDADEARLGAAVDRGAGTAWDGREGIDLAVVAVPPARTAGVLADLMHRELAGSLTHVASCQSHVQRDLEALELDLAGICGGHPLAGREISGPAGATAELFLGRPWVACPGPSTSDAALAAVTALAAACGAQPLVMSAADHDRAVALSSHLPQVAASALAARLAGHSSAVRVSGPGLQDTTRLAASDPDLWVDVLSANAEHVAPLVALLAADLTRLAEALDVLSSRPADAAGLAAVHHLLARGNVGRALVPVKEGVLDQDVTVVAVRVADEPGSLAGLLSRAAAVGVNVEDVRVEHLSGRQTGVVELLVRSDQRRVLAAALSAAGLEVLERG